jgi:hypothetical protein
VQGSCIWLVELRQLRCAAVIDGPKSPGGPTHTALAVLQLAIRSITRNAYDCSKRSAQCKGLWHLTAVDSVVLDRLWHSKGKAGPL